MSKDLSQKDTTGETVVDIEETREERYSSRKKNIFIAIIGLSVFISPCSAQALLPAASMIAEDFGTTVLMIQVSVALYTVGMALSPCITSPLIDIFGRRPLFLVCSAGFTVCNVLVAVSQNLAMFFIFRVITALFGTAFFGIGGSIVKDIYKPSERGNAMGWTLLGSQLGPAFSPVIGGLIVTFTSWRVIFWVLTGLGGLTFGLAFFFIEETGLHLKADLIKEETGKKLVLWVPYNPLKVCVSFRYPNLLLAGVASMSLLYSSMVLTTPIPDVINPRFNLTTPIEGALFYLAPGMGLLVGSLIGGRWADVTVKKFIEINKGKRIPEDRLRSTHISWLVLTVSIIIYGWAIDKEVGGMAVPIIALFFNGVGQTVAFPSLNAYCIDCLPHLGGDALASNYFTRYIAGAIGSATCLLEIEHIGVGWTSTISGFFLLAGYLCCLILIQYNSRLRKVPKLFSNA